MVSRSGEKWMAWCDTIAIARNQGQEELAQIVGKSANCSLAPSTMSAYSSMRYRFEAFASSLPNARLQLGKLRNLFIAHLIHKQQLKCIPMAVASLNFFYGGLKGGEAELQKLLIDSAKRETPSVRHRKKASEEDIGVIINWALQNDSQENIRGACAILISFLAFLRISETVNVQKNHLQYKGAGIWWLYIPRSKTDQFKKGETVAFKVVDTYKILWDKFFEQFIQGSGEEFLFSSCPGLPSSTDALRKHMNEIFRSAGLHHKGRRTSIIQIWTLEVCNRGTTTSTLHVTRGRFDVFLSVDKAVPQEQPTYLLIICFH
ncbi:hypothetical protein COOONC_27268 [Cooperia oncophora]